MRKSKAEAALTREKLLEVALQVFSAQGYSATTLEDIAKAAEVTRGAIYWHFANKAELYHTLLREYGARGDAVVQQAIAEGGTLMDVLRRAFVRVLTLVEEDVQVRALVELALFKTELLPELEAGHRQRLAAGQALLTSLTEAMRQGIAEGALRSDQEPTALAHAFLAFQNGLIQLWLTTPETFSLRESAENYANILFTGLTGSAPPSAVSNETR